MDKVLGSRNTLFDNHRRMSPDGTGLSEAEVLHVVHWLQGPVRVSRQSARHSEHSAAASE